MNRAVRAVPRAWALGGAFLIAACGSSAGGSGDGGSASGGSAGDGGLDVSGAWAAEADDVAAVYLTIDNGGGADRLVEASAGGAGAVSLMGGGGADAGSHTAAHDPVDLEIPPGTTELAPGGRHVMLDDLREPLRPGDRVPLTLEFEGAGARTVAVEIVAWDEVVDRMSGEGGS